MTTPYRDPAPCPSCHANVCNSCMGAGWKPCAAHSVNPKLPAVTVPSSGESRFFRIEMRAMFLATCVCAATTFVFAALGNTEGEVSFIALSFASFVLWWRAARYVWRENAARAERVASNRREVPEFTLMGGDVSSDLSRLRRHLERARAEKV